MQVAVIGGGIAGAMLAWRLVQQPGVAEVLLAPGPARESDATGASGGSVRGFETAPAQRRLALDSMAELAADPILRHWSGFTRCGSVYLPADERGLADALTEIEAVLPGSAALLDREELTRRGWAGLAPDAVALFEAEAGYLSPRLLRRAVLADLVVRSRVRLLATGPVTAIGPGEFRLGDDRQQCDVVVVAAGAWTPALLSTCGFAATGLRTKGIQYTVHEAQGVPSTTFVDDLTGLFGKPVPGGLLLGVPTAAWDVAPQSHRPDHELSRAAGALARHRFPRLRLHPATEPVTAVDCYAEDGMLALRPVVPGCGRLLTFTGGTGSAAKTVLAASLRAARRLAAAGAEQLTNHLPDGDLTSS